MNIMKKDVKTTNYKVGKNNVQSQITLTTDKNNNTTAKSTVRVNGKVVR